VSAKSGQDQVAVAYGLSYTFDDVGRVVPPSQVENITIHSNTKNYTNNYISSEMM
jgi:hypothetical protein